MSKSLSADPSNFVRLTHLDVALLEMLNDFIQVFYPKSEVLLFWRGIAFYAEKVHFLIATFQPGAGKTKVRSIELFKL